MHFVLARRMASNLRTANLRTATFFQKAVSRNDNLRELLDAIKTSKLKMDFPTPLFTFGMSGGSNLGSETPTIEVASCTAEVASCLVEVAS